MPASLAAQAGVGAGRCAYWVARRMRRRKKRARRGSLKRAAHPLRAMAGRGVQLRAKFALSSSHFGSRSLHVANSEALPPPAPAAHALLCIADHRVGGRWSRHSRGTPGQKPYGNPDSNSFSHHGHPPIAAEAYRAASPRAPEGGAERQVAESPSAPARYIAHSITCPSAHAGPTMTGQLHSGPREHHAAGG
jgi:hypothetical protein